MKKAKLFLGVLFTLIAVAATAQNVTVKGSVKDASTGEGIPFASVIAKGTMTGASSNADGVYSITAPKEGTLVFSAVGYVTKEIKIGGETLNVTLDPDSEYLEETVVVGYGSSRKISSLVGSIQTVKSDIVKNAPSSSALDQLQGQVAGLSVLTSTGVAGDNAVSMTLHGHGSLTSSTTPLYVIDGIPSSSRAIMAMNPNDIESISVLKDASATSIYGSRAANGVVYITTKAGAYNEKATVTARFQGGISTLADLTMYKNMMSGPEIKDFWVRSGIHSADWIQTNFTDAGFDADTKWYKYMMNLNTPQYQSDITIQGGGSKVAYMISASQFHQEGFTIGNFFDRYTVRSNVQAHPAKWLKAGMNINLSIDNNRRNGNWNDAETPGASMGLYSMGGGCYRINPLFPAVDENGKIYPKKFPNGLLNSDYYMENNVNRNDRYGFSGNAFIEIEIIKNLKIVSRGGVDGYFKLNNTYTNPSYAAAEGATAFHRKRTYFEYSAVIDNTIEYSFNVAHDHEFSVLAGHEGILNDYQQYYAQANGQVDDRQLLLQQGTAATRAVGESRSQSKFLSFFGHLSYTGLGRYYFDATVRNDASSRFGSKVRNATFWSVGARWNAKKESFLANVGWLNALDVKVSYGTQGNASIGDYSALGLISNSGSYADISARFVSQPANPMLTWEKQALATVGVSGRLFNMLDLNIEYYNRQTSSMLMLVPNPYTSGFTEVTQNVGTLQNQGVDITLGLDIIQTRDAYLRVSGTFSYNQQKVTKLFDGRKRWEIANTGVAYVVGKPVSFYFPIYAGIDPEDGKMMWYLPGDDKDVTTKKETTKVFDDNTLTQNTGKSEYAPIAGGFSLSGGWKGLSLQADFTFVAGKNMINNDAYFYLNPNISGATGNVSKAVSDFWTPSNRNAKFPNWSDETMLEFDTRLLEDASFLRLKNLQVGYSLPKVALNWTKGVVKGIKVTFTGRNLFTVTKYTGIDPEVDSNLTYGRAGNSKQFLGGIEITF